MPRIELSYKITELKMMKFYKAIKENRQRNANYDVREAMRQDVRLSNSEM